VKKKSRIGGALWISSSRQKIKKREIRTTSSKKESLCNKGKKGKTITSHGSKEKGKKLTASGRKNEKLQSNSRFSRRGKELSCAETKEHISTDSDPVKVGFSIPKNEGEKGGEGSFRDGKRKEDGHRLLRSTV